MTHNTTPLTPHHPQPVPLHPYKPVLLCSGSESWSMIELEQLFVVAWQYAHMMPGTCLLLGEYMQRSGELVPRCERN